MIIFLMPTLLLADSKNINDLNGNLLIVPDNFQTIQAAIDSSNNGDTILVDPGIYIEKINFKGKRIFLTSNFLISGDTSYITNTIIDANESGSVVTFNDNEDSRSSISGFTLQNGVDEKGGGVHINNASPILMNLIIQNNSGGGIYFLNSDSKIFNCKIRNNTAWYAAGIYSISSRLTFKSVEISNNFANSVSGGGLLINEQSTVILINATIADNRAMPNGAGIYCHGASNLSIVNTIIWNPSGSEVYLHGGSGANSLTISRSALRGGRPCIVTDPFYADSIFWKEGNIDGDPAFVNPDGFDYRLGNSSPCINTGTPDTAGLDLPLTDLVGNPRIIGGRIDMGAYEYIIDPPPVPDFLITPQAGTREIIFFFDASSSYDTKDSASSLLVRWDWQSDGAWDTEYSAEKTAEHSYAEAGIYTVTLEVKDTDGLTATAQKTLIVANDLNREVTYTVSGDQGMVTAPFLNTTLSLRFLTGSVSGKSLSVAGLGDSLPDSLGIADRFEKAVGYYSLSSENITSFSGTLKIAYNDSILSAAAIPEDSLRIAFYDETLSKWRAAVTTINKDSNTASATIYHFSLWALTDRSDELITSIGEAFSNPGTISSHQLYQNYPNPFNPATSIRFTLPKEERVQITIYNILGQRIRRLAGETFSAGEHTILWDGRDDAGLLLSSGVYIYEIRAGEFIERKKMTLLR